MTRFLHSLVTLILCSNTLVYSKSPLVEDKLGIKNNQDWKGFIESQFPKDRIPLKENGLVNFEQISFNLLGAKSYVSKTITTEAENVVWKNIIGDQFPSYEIPLKENGFVKLDQVGIDMLWTTVSKKDQELWRKPMAPIAEAAKTPGVFSSIQKKIGKLSLQEVGKLTFVGTAIAMVAVMVPTLVSKALNKKRRGKRLAEAQRNFDKVLKIEPEQELLA